MLTALMSLALAVTGLFHTPSSLFGWATAGVALLGSAQILLEKLPISEEHTTLPQPYSLA
jgi:hypothetical protein